MGSGLSRTIPSRSSTVTINHSRGTVSRTAAFASSSDSKMCGATPRLRERFAELGVHEGAGGEARHSVEIAVAHFLHRVEIGVLDIRGRASKPS